MKSLLPFRATVAWLLIISLCLPPVFAAGDKAGKRNFKAGAKYESAEQWDLAAQQYALAVASEPGNTEYRLRLVRAVQMASLMFIARGDLAEAKEDFASAYNAYAQAYTYDRTNEAARVKMARMLEQQRVKEGFAEPVPYNPRTGALLPASHEIRTVQTKSKSELLQRIEFNEGATLKQALTTLARQLELNLVFDESFKDSNKFSLVLNDVTTAKAFDIVLLQSKHFFEQLDRRTIMIYADNPQNRQRLERLLVKTFYLSNADPGEARGIVQANLGGQRQVNISKQLNALVVRATPAELEVAQAVLESLDKNRSEVIIDVNIYEVSNTTSLEIGNQLATSSATATNGTVAGLNDLGGLGRAGVSALAGSVFGFGGSLGSIIGLPTSSLSLLQTKGKSRLLASTQIHAADGEQNQTVVGRSVPVRLGTSYLNGYSASTTTTGTTATGTTGTTGTVDNIQYRDVGLVIDVTPTITNEGYVQVKLKLESSNVEAAGSDANLTPTFTKRSLTTISRVQDGVTAVVASVKQDNQGDSRATIPLVGLVPILGRLFTTPKQTSSQSDIVITVTPHINRTPDINPTDHLARQTGSQQSGFTQSIEEVLYRAQSEDEHERRLISQQQLLVPELAPTSPVAAGPTAAGINNAAKPATLAPEKAAEAQIFKLLTSARVEVGTPNPTEQKKPDSPLPEKTPNP
jgi:general secretion pathway protein D